jgi:3-dehydroquinate synthetase
MAKAGEAMGITKTGVFDSLKEALIKNGLPFCTTFTPAEVFEAAAQDKKRAGDKIAVVLPVNIGMATIKEIPAPALLDILKLGMEV